MKLNVVNKCITKKKVCLRSLNSVNPHTTKYSSGERIRRRNYLENTRKREKEKKPASMVDEMNSLKVMKLREKKLSSVFFLTNDDVINRMYY